MIYVLIAVSCSILSICRLSEIILPDLQPLTLKADWLTVTSQVAAFYYPNPPHGESGTGETGAQHAAEPAAPEASSAPEHAAKLAMRLLTG